MADSIASLFRAGDPGRVAVHFLRSQSKGGFRDEQITLGDWVRGADACAAALEARGLRRGQRVLLCLPTGRAFLDAFLGAISIGVVPVPLPSLEGFARPAAFVNRLTSVVQDAAPSALRRSGCRWFGRRVSGKLGGRGSSARQGRARS